MTTLRPTADFDPLRISWGGPDEPIADNCSYCDAPIPDDDVPLMMWNVQGWCARFCKACRVRYWGFQEFDDDQDEG